MYELGLLVAFLLWVYNSVMVVVNANSLLSRNLAKVGMRLSWWTAQPVPIGDNASTGWRVFSALLLVVSGLIGILFSWVSVAGSIGMILYQRSKGSGMPQAVKELRWKLRNIDMTRDQILSEMAAAHEAVVPTTTSKATQA